MGAYIVYIDVLLLLNFCLDFLLLWASGRFLRRRVSVLRLLAASAVGAVYGAGIVFRQVAVLYTLPAVVLASVLILLVAYPFISAGAFLKLVGLFYLVAFAMAGSVIAGATLLGQYGVSTHSGQLLQTWTLAAVVPVVIVVGRRGYRFLQQTFQKEDFYAELELWVQQRCCSLKVLIDTGNDLREPLSGLPVLVADLTALQPVLPVAICRLCRQRDTDAAQMLAEASGVVSSWRSRFRLIPFSSIGRKNGMLLGFRPDRVLLYYRGKTVETDAVVGIVPQGLGSAQTYRAVANPTLFMDAEYREEEASA